MDIIIEIIESSHSVKSVSWSSGPGFSLETQGFRVPLKIPYLFSKSSSLYRGMRAGTDTDIDRQLLLNKYYSHIGH